MPLFIAINFPERTKAALLAIQSRLRQIARGGNFSRAENLHLTLVFLGEVPESRVPAITAAMDGLRTEPFTLRFEGAGKFGDTWWVGIGGTPALSALQRQLAEALRAAGFAIEGRAFRPHMTLGRQIALPPGADTTAVGGFPPFTAGVGAIHLMLSERVQGKLTYTALHERKL